jgi:hypothetical protein
VLKDSKSTCLMKLAKKKKKTLVGTGSWRARNSSQNLVRREEHHGDCVNKKFGDWWVHVLKDSKSICLVKLTKKKKKTRVGPGSWGARNSSHNLVGRTAPQTLCK